MLSACDRTFISHGAQGDARVKLWTQWLQAVRFLRPACQRSLTFVWMALVLRGLCCRSDNLGVTSFVRALNLSGNAYHRLLHLFHSKALDLDVLTSCWCACAWCQTFAPTVGQQHQARVHHGPFVAGDSSSGPLWRRAGGALVFDHARQDPCGGVPGGAQGCQPRQRQTSNLQPEGSPQGHGRG